MCNNKVSQFVPSGYSYKSIEMKCGETSVEGERLICRDCESSAVIMAGIAQRKADMDADNQWLASAGWGEM